jgi:3-deoxy-7-phosphoheptulonate synthase
MGMSMSSGGFAALRARANDLARDLRPFRYDLILGPCAVESEAQLAACALAASEAGATYLRGGAIKLRTRHHSFAGMGVKAWQMLRQAADPFGMRTISEVTSPADVASAADYLDALQIGARSMWNFDLLRECARSAKTVVLKRGLGASTADWLAAGERLQEYGCSDLILCERGNPAADPGPRNAIDLSTLAFLTAEVPLPVWLDVSHSAGDPVVAFRLLQLARGLGLHGAMAEIHPDPGSALCDGEQAIPLSALRSAQPLVV